MKTKAISRIGWKRLLPVVISFVVLLGMTAVFANDWRKMSTRDQDKPPVIEFTWTPLGEVDLRDFRGLLRMTDDYNLDFTSYRMQVIELGKTYDMPIPGMLGREYEAPISLGLLAENPDIQGQSQLTIRFEIADDRGQKAELERVVRIKPIAPPVSVITSGPGIESPEGTVTAAPGISITTTPVP